MEPNQDARAGPSRTKRTPFRAQTRSRLLAASWITVSLLEMSLLILSESGHVSLTSLEVAGIILGYLLFTAAALAAFLRLSP